MDSEMLKYAYTNVLTFKLHKGYIGNEAKGKTIQ